MGIHLILVLYLSLSMSRRSEKKVSSYFCSIQSYGCRVELFHPLHVSYGGSMHFWGFNCPEGPFTHLRFHHHQQFHNVHNAQWQGFGLALASWQVLDLKDRKLHTLRIEILRNHSSFWNPMGYHGILPKSPGKHRMTSHEIPWKSESEGDETEGLESLLEALQAGTPSASLSRQCVLLVAVPIVL